MILPLILLALSASCLPESSAPQPELTQAQMMDSTVKVQVDMGVTVVINVVEDGKKTVKEWEDTDGWTGSGVVYDKNVGLTSQPESKILTANHVLEVPKVGSWEKITFFGVELGKKRVNWIKTSILTRDGRTCQLETKKLGVSDHRDTATAVAFCDAGRVAKIASSVPAAGERVFVSGYPLGVDLPLVTSGTVSGWTDKYLMTSAPAYGGNSGGPVFYNGEVIGLLVRGSRDYPILTLVAPLRSVLDRIAETCKE